MVGQTLKRSLLHDHYGGSRQSGIASAPHSGCVLLFSGDEGRQFGYNHDGFQEDGSFHYTGEGQVGPQRLDRGNGAILKRTNRLLLFRMRGKGMVEYLGEFALDDEQPWYYMDAPDRNGDTRQVVVFRLWPVGRVAEPTVRFGLEVRQVPVERTLVSSFRVAPGVEATEMQRREAALLYRYKEWLERRNHTTARHEIRLPDTPASLLTDLFDVESNELIEAKASPARQHVRMALGQLLDYNRYVEANKLAVLLPGRPLDDLVDLLVKNGVSCIYEEADTGDFARADALTAR